MAPLAYTVFGEQVTVTEEDGVWWARLPTDSEHVWGRGEVPLAALGDCVIRWSLLQEAAKATAADAVAPPGDASSGNGPADPRMCNYASQVLLAPNGLPGGRSSRRRSRSPGVRLSVGPAPDARPAERTIFGQRATISCHGPERYVAQIEGARRMWWGHGATAEAALADCVLNWGSPAARVPEQLDGPQAEYELLGQRFVLVRDAEGYSAHLARSLALSARASPREALAACVMLWGRDAGDASQESADRLMHKRHA